MVAPGRPRTGRALAWLSVTFGASTAPASARMLPLLISPAGRPIGRRQAAGGTGVAERWSVGVLEWWKGLGGQ